MKIELLWPEEVILDEIKSGEYARDEVAITYAFCIDSKKDIHFGKINRAIQERWSRNAVIYIKTKAWKLIEAKKGKE